MGYDFLKVKKYEEYAADVAEEGDYYILSFPNGDHIKVSHLAKTIIEKFDGNKTVHEIVIALNKEEIIVTDEDIVKFIDTILKSNNILENFKDAEQESQKGRLWFHLPLIKVSKIERFLKPLTVLFYKPVVLVLMFLVLLSQLYSLIGGFYSNLIKLQMSNINSLGIIAIVFLSSIFHEFGHVVAALKYDITVENMGIGMYIFRPVKYVDMTNTWKLNKKKRIVTDLGGVYFQIIFILPLSLLLLFYNSYTLKLSILTILGSLLINVNPIIRTDGYWVITDLLGIVNLSKRSLTMCKESILYFLRVRKEKPRLEFNINKHLKKIFYGYSVAYLLFTFGFMSIGMYLVIKLFANLSPIVESFNLLCDSILQKDIVLLLKRFNNLFIVILPILYFAFFIFTFVKGVLRGITKKTLAKRNLKNEGIGQKS